MRQFFRFLALGTVALLCFIGFTSQASCGVEVSTLTATASTSDFGTAAGSDVVGTNSENFLIVTDKAVPTEAKIALCVSNIAASSVFTDFASNGATGGGFIDGGQFLSIHIILFA